MLLFQGAFDSLRTIAHPQLCFAGLHTALALAHFAALALVNFSALALFHSRLRSRPFLGPRSRYFSDSGCETVASAAQNRWLLLLPIMVQAFQEC